VSSWGYLLQIYSGLVALDHNLEVAPELASDWSLDESGTVYTFNLRPEAKFHDGRPVTAADFKYSLERATDPKLRSPVADLYLGDIVGVSEKLAGKASEIQGVKVRGDHVLEITTDAAKPYFLAKLTYPTGYVVDQKNVSQGANWWQRPNGTGPFKLKKWIKEEEILLEANPHYYGEQPGVAEVSFFVGGGSAMAMYERDELDVTIVGPADIGRVTDPRSPLNEELVVVPQLSIWYLGFNTKVKPFDDPKVRQAFNMATDKRRIVEVLLRKTRLQADGILPPGMPGYNENLTGLPFDVTNARQLLDDSSYGGAENLPPITLTTGAGAGGLGESFAEMYAVNLGVQVNVEQVDRGFFDDLNAQRFQMFYVGWVADYPDPQDFLDVLFHSSSSGNHTGYSNAEVDGLLEQARVEKDQEKRWQLYRQAEEAIVNDAPWVPLFHDVDYVLVKPRVQGLVWTPVGIVSLKGVTVAPQAKPGTL
jgi:ABC-type transport system substrate-binding protein